MWCGHIILRNYVDYRENKNRPRHPREDLWNSLGFTEKKIIALDIIITLCYCCYRQSAPDNPSYKHTLLTLKLINNIDTIVDYDHKYTKLSNSVLSEWV